MSEQASTIPRPRVRLGVVTYLNARPLTVALKDLAPEAEIVVDLPSRLADGLADDRLDVALIPSIESLRNAGYTIVSDACIACDGPVQSVKLYSRVPMSEIQTLALDEGSRTSAVLSRILLKERFGLEPRLQRLPIGTAVDDATAQAAVLIGDRAMRPQRSFAFSWDLGQEWSRFTGLPFVFAMWTARPGVDLAGIGPILAAARDEGLTRLAEIARIEAPAIGISKAQCLSYLRDHLDFRLGARQWRGLQRFFELAGRHQLAPEGVELAHYTQ